MYCAVYLTLMPLEDLGVFLDFVHYIDPLLGPESGGSFWHEAAFLRLDSPRMRQPDDLIPILVEGPPASDSK